MTRKIALSLLIILGLSVCSFPAENQAGTGYQQVKKIKKFGLGFVLGTVNALDIKYYFGDIGSLDIRIGPIADRIESNINYFWSFSNINVYPKWVPYMGPGLAARTGGKTIERVQVGVNPGGQPKYDNVEVDRDASLYGRLGLGLMYNVEGFDFFIEMIYSMDMTPVTGNNVSDFNVAGGLHVYF